MKSLGAAAAAADKRARHRKFHWCRQANDFIDMPLWRLVAQMLGMPLHQVQAFVLRLESLANRSLPRGYVGDFNAAEFGVALGMATEDSARIYAALESAEVGWILQQHLATFWERNPDLEDATAAERKQRERSFKRAADELVDLARRGVIDEGRRLVAERAIAAMRDEARRGLLPLDEQRRSLAELLGALLSPIFTGGQVSRRDSVTAPAALTGSVVGVTVSRRDIVTSQRDARDIVTVTPEQTTKLEGDAVDNSGAAPEDPEAWLGEQGVRVVAQRMTTLPSLAATRVERWKRELNGDAAALAVIIDAADQANQVGAAFHVSVTEQIKRRLRDAEGPRLPLMKPIAGKRTG